MDLNFNTHDDPEGQVRHTRKTIKKSQIVGIPQFLNGERLPRREPNKANTQQLLQLLVQILHLIQEAQNDEAEPHMFAIPISSAPSDSLHYYELVTNQASQISASSDIVSGGNINVGISLTGKLIPNDKIVDINGQQYSIDFLKLQVADYANSTYADPPDSAISLTYNDHSWGYPNGYNYYAYRFESYISNAFPLGEPSLFFSQQAESLAMA